MKDNNSFIIGGISGTIARNIVAPIDKIKILMQITDKNQNFYQHFIYDIKNNGFKNLWKGNLINSFRIFPYSGIQFYVYNKCKKNIKICNNIFLEKLIYGSISGICAVTATQPLDVIRHRLMYYQNNNIYATMIDIYKENGIKSFYKGYIPNLIGLTPYIAINFCTYDILKNNIFNKNSYILSATLSAIISQTICYPLDTIRRNIYIKNNKGLLNVTKNIFVKKGIYGFYKGIMPNAIKIVPQNIIRFLVYEKLNNSFF